MSNGSPMIRSFTASLSCALLVLLATGCSQPPPRPEAAEKLPLVPYPVTSIRNAGTGDDSVVQVAPLRDAAVDGLLKQARDAEAKRDWKAAAVATERALALAPEAPDILQDLAEREVALGHFQRAEELAMKSFELGPRLGGLCARNWQTVVVARTALNDPVERDKAAEQVTACRKSGPKRG